MSIRQIVTVDRGMTDKTPIIIFPWEYALLELIHGEGAVVVHDVDELCSTKGSNIVAKLKLKHSKVHAPNMREQLEIMLNTVPEEIDPFDNPRAEYDRMASVYGMHPEVRESIVENVYGKFSNGTFANLVNSVKDGATMPIRYAGAEDEVDELDTEQINVEAMEGHEVRELLKDKGVAFKANDSVAKLKERLTVILALDADGVDYDVNAPIDELKSLAEALA